MPGVGVISRLLRRSHRRASSSDPSSDSERLRPAGVVRERYREQGATRDAAITEALAQLDGLKHEVESDDRWSRLVRLARQAGDPWNADDWPLGFDALTCAVSLCTHVDYECARCPIGQAQDARSCAHPTTAFGRIGILVKEAEREALLAHIAAVQSLLEDALRDAGSSDSPT